MPETTSSFIVIHTPASSSGKRLRKNSSGLDILPSSSPEAARGAALELMAADHGNDREDEEAKRGDAIEEQIVPCRCRRLLAVEQQLVVADDTDQRAVLYH